QEGTGRKSRVPGYRTGGKTGTAEKIDEETGQRAAGRYLVSFIGAAPINDPEVVVYVVIDEPNVATRQTAPTPRSCSGRSPQSCSPIWDCTPPRRSRTSC